MKKKKRKSELDFDELNRLDYFEPMQISKDDKQRRRDLSGFLIDAFLYFFMTFETHKAHNALLTRDAYARMLGDKVSDAVSKVTGIDGYMSDHIKEMSREVVDTTFKNEIKPDHADKPKSDSHIDSPLLSLSEHQEKPIKFPDVRRITPPEPSVPPLSGGSNDNKADSDSSEDKKETSDYWLSYRRAEDIAKSEANTFLNYTDYLDAVNSGKTKKTWLTMLDDKVRPTHDEVEGLTIGIDELFYVGDSQMKFPHDLSESPNPKEVIGCRCSVEYS